MPDQAENLVEAVEAAVAAEMREENTEVAVMTIDTIGTVTPQIFTKKGAVDSICSMIEEEVDKFVPDTSTATGRKAIGSIAHRVATSKTHLTKQANELTADAKSQIAIVTCDRKRMEERLDALKRKVRKPLTEHEGAERQREQKSAEVCKDIRLAMVTREPDDTPNPSEELRAKLATVTGITLDGMEGFTQDVIDAQEAAVVFLRDAIDARIQAEKQDAETAKIHARNQELEAAEAERLRFQAVKDAEGQKRIADAAAKEIADKAEADRKQKSVDAQKLRDEKIADKAVADAAQEVKAKAVSDAAEKASRERNELNRARVRNEIIEDFVAFGISADQAELAAEALIDGKIDAVTVDF